MVDYRRMGNMEQHYSRNATSTTSFLHQLRDLWKSPRGTVLRVEALALAAIAFSFLLVALGACRRWSKRWIIQKGFLAANVLSISLGTYSIGLMQSSSVKSEMYPVWAVSLLTLFGCVDPVTSYNGLDYKGPLSKMIFQLCLYCGYVLLMSISTISSDVANIAIGVLSAVNFFKGFHRSLALVLPRRMRKMIRHLKSDAETNAISDLDDYDYAIVSDLVVDFPLDMDDSKKSFYSILARDGVLRNNISLSCEDMVKLRINVGDCHDVCTAFALSHLLQRHFIGLSDASERKNDMSYQIASDFNRAFKVIEVELAFLYDIFFTGNAFLHYYQAKTASFWAFASFIGICFVGVAAAIPGTMTSRHSASLGPGAGTITTADLTVTLVILVSLALLQLLQLIRCWTSNWARVAFACEHARNMQKGTRQPLWWMRLKGFLVTRINWFDKYLWQDKLGQHSVIEASSRKEGKLLFSRSGRLYVKCARFLRMVGLQYVGEVLWELVGSDSSTGPAVRLHPDVKGSIAEFLGRVHNDTIGESWSSLFVANGVDEWHLPHWHFDNPAAAEQLSYCCLYTRSVMMWHVATCYCELAEQAKQKERTGAEEKSRRVALALSKYCAHLLVSAPELLPGTLQKRKGTYDGVASEARRVLQGAKDKLEAMRSEPYIDLDSPSSIFWDGVRLAKQLFCGDVGDPWKLLEVFWVQALLYAAPYGDVEVHMQHLSQGGELITHLWALLYHAHIYSWKTVERWGGKPMKLETEEVEENPKDGGQFKGDQLNTCSKAEDNPSSSIPLQSATDIEENSMDMDSEVEIEDDISSCSKDDNPNRISIPVQADIRWM
ncbi:uncharacterized protein [Aegilops tauschii subsp. strangulata]|nr:uncharacterized protein LOC109761819 [Aegilops tauschii subsp. strangulata]